MHALCCFARISSLPKNHALPMASPLVLRRALGAVCAVLLLPFGVFASGENHCDGESAGQAPLLDQANCLLWQITHKDLEDTSWLFGTIHLINQDDFVVRSEVQAAMSACPVVAFELKLNDLGMMAKMMRMMQLPGDSTLADVLDEAQHQLLRTYVEDSSGMDFAAFERQKPLALMQLQLQNMIPGTPASYELHFLQMALSTGQEVVGLEQIEDQMAVFDGIPYAEQVEWIMDLFVHADSMAEVYAQLVEAYLDEDLKQMYALMLEESPELAAYSESLLFERNRNWIPKIETLMRQRSTFIAVGAAHLPGPQGVVKLLQEAGYLVEPVFASTQDH